MDGTRDEFVKGLKVDIADNLANQKTDLFISNNNANQDDDSTPVQERSIVTESSNTITTEFEDTSSNTEVIVVEEDSSPIEVNTLDNTVGVGEENSQSNDLEL